ncbi:Eukaryotic initiation factor 4A [Brachionus plicatilis]|uniref:Eukaryotic initiation factor 4A n=1 Tax=Brachionus plicatilis TaxID=10195 RepID=A0A3M7QRQ5_BRAPC|nr:Eukaryotic initiation factor 4A [Brachionus plicatilis]
MFNDCFSSMSSLELVSSCIFLFFLNMQKIVKNLPIILFLSNIIVCHSNYLPRYSYVGCFRDSSLNPDLNKLCISFCASKLTRYAGLQSGDQCHCDNKYGNYGYISFAGCIEKCTGNYNQICGGRFFNSIYVIIPKVLSTVTKTTSNGSKTVSSRFGKTHKSNSIPIYSSAEPDTIQLSKKNIELNYSTLYWKNENIKYFDFTFSKITPTKAVTKEIASLNFLDVEKKTMNWKTCPNEAFKNSLFKVQLEYVGEQIIILDFPQKKIKKIPVNGKGILNFWKIFNTTGKFDLLAYSSNQSFKKMCQIKVLAYSNSKSVINLNNNEYMSSILTSNIDLTDCLNNCSNNGICKVNSDSTFGCSCFEDFAGMDCRQDTRPCSSAIQCLNNATCIELNSTDLSGFNFKCNCSKNFFGTRCQNLKKDLCSNKTCSKNGHCVYKADQDEIECKCFKLYSGANCEIESDEAKSIKATIKTSMIIAIIIISLTYLIFICVDLATLSKK